jgi:hypothetical protein
MDRVKLSQCGVRSWGLSVSRGEESDATNRRHKGARFCAFVKNGQRKLYEATNGRDFR